MRRVGSRAYQFAFQSAGQSAEPWLGPDAGMALEQLAKGGAKHALICPIGFVADHLEVLYDIDVERQRQAAQLGIQLERTDSLNSAPLLIEALADLVMGAARQHGWVP
jgi:ferrochelatase